MQSSDILEHPRGDRARQSRRATLGPAPTRGCGRQLRRSAAWLALAVPLSVIPTLARGQIVVFDGSPDVVAVIGTADSDTVKIFLDGGDQIRVELTTSDITHSADFPASRVQMFIVYLYEGDDRIRNVTSVPTVVDGGDGNDFLAAGSGADALFGGKGDDVAIGGAGDDRLSGGADDDILLGGLGDDILAGFAGLDFLSGDEGDDGLDGGFDDDQIFGGPGQDDLLGGPGGDLIRGGAHDDYLMGGEGVDALYGEAGNDTLDGEPIDDILDGGLGEDVVSIERGLRRFGIVINPANDPDSSAEDHVRAFQRAATVAGQASVFFDFVNQYALPSVIEIVPVAAGMGLRTLVQIVPQAVGYPDPPPGMPKTFSDPAVRALYLNNVRDLAQLRPTTMVLAPEVNFLYWVSPQEFDYFKTLYAEAVALVRQVSPLTELGISVHYDLFFACRQFEMLDELRPRDFVGLTNYPEWMINEDRVDSVAEYSPNFWSWMRWALPDEKLIVTEIGFSNTGKAGEGTAQEQFVARLPELMGGLRPDTVNWILLTDSVYFTGDLLSEELLALLLRLGVDVDALMAQFNGMGLHSHSGFPKRSWFEAVKMKLTWPDEPGHVTGTPMRLDPPPEFCTSRDAGRAP